MADACYRLGVELGAEARPNSSRVEHAMRRVDQWLARGLRVLRRHTQGLPGESLPDLPPMLFAWGSADVTGLKAAAVLNSRKPRRIAPDEPWVRVTRILFHEACRDHCAVVSSYGTVAYAVVSRLARVSSVPLIMVCDEALPFMQSGERMQAFVDRHHDLFHPRTTLVVSPFPPGGMPSSAARNRERDKLVIALSLTVYVAAVRGGGNMEALVIQASRTGTRIRVFVPGKADSMTAGNLNILGSNAGRNIEPIWLPDESASPPREIANPVEKGRVPRRVLKLRNWPGSGLWLVHYTRSLSGPWPGQTLGQYCQCLIDGHATCGHTGFDTLTRILDEGLIRGSARLIRGNVPVVSFTECLPGELEQLVKWRSGLIRWSFEPYGIAIDKATLIKLGAEAVIYGGEQLFRTLPKDKRYLFQILKDSGPDWSVEREWRLPKDLALESVPLDCVTVIVATLEQAWLIRREYPYEVTLAGTETMRTRSPANSHGSPLS